MEFVAAAPAPLTATPVLPTATESEAAVVTVVILEDSLASTFIMPDVAVTPSSALAM